MEPRKDRPQTSGEPDNTTALSQAGAFGTTRRDRFKLALGTTVFILLTVSIFLYQFSRLAPGDDSFTWSGLRFEYLWLMLLCLPFDTLATGLRIWLVCHVLQPGTGFWTCLKAEWANSGIAMLTPSQTGGGFGQIYVLHRGGVSVSTATTISLITFLGTMVSLLVVGFYSVLISGVALDSLFSVAIWPLTIVLGLMTVALLWPGLFRAAVSHALKAYRRISNLPDSYQGRIGLTATKLIDLVYNYHDGTWRFVRTGKAEFVGVCLLSFVFILARCTMAFLCLRFLGIENSTLGEVLQIQMALLFLLYFAPTPGSSGLAEVFSLSAMAAIVPAGFAPYYNLIWRTSTVYLPAVLGLAFITLSLLRDARSVLHHRALGLNARKQIEHSQPVRYPADRRLSETNPHGPAAGKPEPQPGERSLAKWDMIIAQ
jgi:glycosyltransferase 2 family protein